MNRYGERTERNMKTMKQWMALGLVCAMAAGAARGGMVCSGTSPAIAVEAPLTLDVDGQTVACTPVDVGNPHAVIFTDDAESAPLTTLGPAIEHHPAFPGGVNVEFVQILRRNELRMRVWERGSGVTLACGTGTCASAAAAAARGDCDYDTGILAHLDGGDLRITVGRDGRVFMEGPCEFVYEGDTEIC